MGFNGKSLIIIGSLLFTFQIANFISIDTITPELERAQVLAAIASVIIILTGFLFKQFEPLAGEKADLKGENRFFLDKKIPEFDFINGGVDGQSSYGYKRAIKFWHSKYLDPQKTDSIIFYTGTNDVRFIANDLTNYDVAQTKIRYFQNLLKDNSFIINKFLELRNKLQFIQDSKKTNSQKGHNSHYARTEEFKEKGTLYEIKNELKLSEYKKYSEIYQSLLDATKNKFPSSNIYVIQQQIPGCNFINKKKVIDRHPDNFEHEFCLDLMKVYLIQEKIIAQFFNENNIKIAPMYLRPYLRDDDVYDHVHTNSKGSLKIAEYIASFLKLKYSKIPGI